MPYRRGRDVKDGFCGQTADPGRALAARRGRVAALAICRPARAGGRAAASGAAQDAWHPASARTLPLMQRRGAPRALYRARGRHSPPASPSSVSGGARAPGTTFRLTATSTTGGERRPKRRCSGRDSVKAGSVSRKGMDREAVHDVAPWDLRARNRPEPVPTELRPGAGSAVIGGDRTRAAMLANGCASTPPRSVHAAARTAAASAGVRRRRPGLSAHRLPGCVGAPVCARFELMRRGHGFSRQQHFLPIPEGGNGIGPARGGGRVRRGRQDHEGTGSAGDVVVRGRPVKAGPARSGRSFSGGGVAAREGTRGERAGPLRQNRAPRARVMFAGARHGPAASMGVREPLQP